MRAAEPLSRVELHFGRPATALPIPPRLLAAPLAHWEESGRRARPHDATGEAPELPTDFVGSLKQLPATYFAEGPPRIEVVARAAGCSVRTLQRRLQESGLSFSRLIEDVRLSAAAERLLRTGHKLVDIAFDAGYSDQANFTRAFRRWAGMAPSQFRRQSLPSLDDLGRQDLDGNLATELHVPGAVELPQPPAPRGSRIS